MNVRLLRGAAALWLTAAMATGLAGIGDAPAHADTSLVGWTAQADANPFDIIVDNDSGLGGVHPLSEIVLPEDTSDYESGPFGHGLATIFWPGAVLGNLHSIGEQAGLPPQLAPLFVNDPVRAESFYPAGPKAATYPSSAPGGVAEMSSYADGNSVWSKAGLTDVAMPGLFDIQAVHGNTTATATDKATSTASGTFHSLSLLGGVIQMGATTSSASAGSDGVSPAGQSSTRLGAITIAGLPVSYGSDGLTVGSTQSGVPSALLATLTTVVNQLIAAVNLKIQPLARTEIRRAPAEEITSGGVSISFTLPPSLNIPSLDCSRLPGPFAQLGILCHLPDELRGLHVVFTIGRVRASAIAAQPFPFAAGGLLGGTGPGDAGGIGLGSPGSSGAVGLPANAVPGAVTPPELSNPNRSGSGLGRLNPVSLSSPVTAGLLLALLALALVFGASLPRLARTLEAPPPTVCPAEEANEQP